MERVEMAAKKFMVLVTAGLLGMGAHAQAGFLDDFARAFRAPAPRQIFDYGPLEMTVKKPRRRPTRSIESSSQSVQTVKIDPVSDPSWYLRDPTLRRGDIVVTQRGVLVYKGRDSDALHRGDFAELVAGRAGPKNWQHQLNAAARSGRSFFAAPYSTPKTETIEAKAY